MLGDAVQRWLGSARLTVGLDNLKGLFQTNHFYDFKCCVALPKVYCQKKGHFWKLVRLFPKKRVLLAAEIEKGISLLTQHQYVRYELLPHRNSSETLNSTHFRKWYMFTWNVSLLSPTPTSYHCFKINHVIRSPSGCAARYSSLCRQLQQVQQKLSSSPTPQPFIFIIKITMATGNDIRVKRLWLNYKRKVKAESFGVWQQCQGLDSLSLLRFCNYKAAQWLPCCWLGRPSSSGHMQGK